MFRTALALDLLGILYIEQRVMCWCFVRQVYSINIDEICCVNEMTNWLLKTPVRMYVIV